jgi:hypothetical protein
MSLNSAFRPAGIAEKGKYIFSLAYSFLAFRRYHCAKKQHRFSIGEDQFYRNTCFRLVQAENAEKQVFFTILQFMYGNFPSLW